MNEDILGLTLSFVGFMAVVFTAAKIAFTIINRRRPELPQSSVSLDEISRQLTVLQQTIDATAIEVERLGESQRFTTKLLAERADAANALGPGARPPG